MKPKTFRDPAWPLYLTLELLLAVIACYMILMSIYLFVIAMGQISRPGTPFALVLSQFLCLGLGIGMPVLISNYMQILDRAFGKLYIYNNEIILKCPFRRTKTVEIEDCNYVGIEDFSLINRVFPVIRGDEISFIYLSTKPYPEQYKGKITQLKSKKGFIKFAYTDEIAEALFDVLPAQRCYRIKGFYGQMQANDIKTKQRKKQKKNKKD